MRKIRPILGVLLVLACALSIAVTANAVPIHQHSTTKIQHSEIVGHDATGPLVRRWTTTREIMTVVNVAPADSDDDGYADGTDGCPAATYASNGGCPPPPPPDPGPAVAYPTSVESAPVEASTVAPATSGSCPSYMSGEASSPTDVNSSSGAEGCFQVIPSTAASMGAACDDVNALSCMQAICAAQGNDAWDAADPC